VLADCGGGTVDVFTYDVEKGTPLRMRINSDIPKESGLYGSSLLNDKCADLVKEKLKDQAYLFSPRSTLDMIAADCGRQFEDLKREVDTLAKGFRKIPLSVPGLRRHPGRPNLVTDTLILERLVVLPEFDRKLIGASLECCLIFESLLEGIRALVERQLTPSTHVRIPNLTHPQQILTAAGRLAQRWLGEQSFPSGSPSSISEKLRRRSSYRADTAYNCS